MIRVTCARTARWVLTILRFLNLARIAIGIQHPSKGFLKHFQKMLRSRRQEEKWRGTHAKLWKRRPAFLLSHPGMLPN